MKKLTTSYLLQKLSEVEIKMKTFKDISRKETDLEEACWVGYKKVGMKKKGDRMVPNCVKEEVVNEVYGKDFVYSENVGDMYKGKLSDTQITNLKNLWKTKKQSDVTPSVKSYVKGLDQFTKMDIKQANIKYLSNLIDSVQNEEVDFISPLQDQIEIIEMNSLVRKVDIEEAYFSADQLERLAKAYNVMKDKTISLANAKKLGKMVDGIPAGALNDLRKKKIPFISGLALSRMIKLKVPVTEDLDKDDKKTIEPIIKQLQKSVTAHGKQAKQLKKDIKDEKDLEEADLSKSQITKVHKQADDLPKKDFMKRYGKDGDAVRYATATNMVKKKLGINEAKEKEMYYLEFDVDSSKEYVTGPDRVPGKPKAGPDRALAGIEVEEQVKAASMEEAFRHFKQVTIKYTNRMKGKLKLNVKFMGTFPRVSAENKRGERLTQQLSKDIERRTMRNEDNELINKGELKMNESYKLKLNSAMEHYKIASLAELKDEDQKAFFSYVDSLSRRTISRTKETTTCITKSNSC